MKKAFGTIALLLTLAACNMKEMEIQPGNQSGSQSDSFQGITITATLAPKKAITKAVADNGDNKITATWAQGEKIAILYEVDETKMVAEANIDAVDAETGSATISFTVDGGTAEGTACTIVYPASAANDECTGLKDNASLLGAQNGTLNPNLDVRVGEGTIGIAKPGLDVTTQPAPQFAIFKFTAKNEDASAAVPVNSLSVTIDAQDYVITPASAASELYAALPPIASKAVVFSAKGSDGKTYTADFRSISFAAGYFYQSALKLTPASYAVPLYKNTSPYQW